jgi:sugar lactone lactonase YvrE
MRLPLLIVVSLLPAQLWSQQAESLGEPVRVVDSIPGPESVAVGPDGAWYVSAFGKFDNGMDGAVYRVDPETGSRKVYATGLEDPCGVIFAGSTLWVADRKGVYRVTRGKAELVYPAKVFPRELHFLNDLASGGQGELYVSDTGDSTAAGHGAVFRLTAGGKPSVVPGSDTMGTQFSTNGLFRAGGDSLFVVGYRTGVLSVSDGRGHWRDLAKGLGAPDGIDAAPGGGFYISDNIGGDLFLVRREPGAKPIKIASGLEAPADLVVDQKRGLLLVPENSGNRLAVYRVGAK